MCCAVRPGAGREFGRHLRGSRSPKPLFTLCAPFLQPTALARSAIVTSFQPFQSPSTQDLADAEVEVEQEPIVVPAPVATKALPDLEPRPALPQSWQPTARPRREYNEVKVPAGSLSRAFQFGTLVRRLVFASFCYLTSHPSRRCKWLLAQWLKRSLGLWV